MSIRRKRHWGWRDARCDRRSGETSIPSAVPGRDEEFGTSETLTESGRRRSVQSCSLDTAALSGHLLSPFNTDSKSRRRMGGDQGNISSSHKSRKVKSGGRASGWW